MIAAEAKRNKIRPERVAPGTGYSGRRQVVMEPVTSHSEPGDVNAEQGIVIVGCPDGVAATLTADAAEETGRRMIRAASGARLQQANPSPPGPFPA